MLRRRRRRGVRDPALALSGAVGRRHQRSGDTAGSRRAGISQRPGGGCLLYRETGEESRQRIPPAVPDHQPHAVRAVAEPAPAVPVPVWTVLIISLISIG